MSASDPPSSSPSSSVNLSLRFWLVGFLVGAAGGLGAVAFRYAVDALQTMFYGYNDVTIADGAAHLPVWLVILVPVLGGLVVGVILQRYTPDCRARTVAHVIEGAALRDGRVEGRAGLASTFASLITLSTGGSTGREGPVVQLAAVISSKVSRYMKADGVTGRDLMGCAVAAAVAASFNAPIAGAIFAMEVVLRHYAVHAFGPIALSAVTGTVISRLAFGDFTEFSLPTQSLEFYVELPAFAILGAISGLIAVVMARSIFFAQSVGDAVEARLRLQPWMRPMLAGLALGLIATQYPHIIGVGYHTTSRALNGDIVIFTAILFAGVKCAAVAITIGGRMGGGVFSPALMMGALSGLAFGWVATAIFPTVSGAETLYAFVGMGAVGAAVMGAPISTALLVFEMTGDWQLGIAVLVAVAVSTNVASRFMARSFFLEQLDRMGIQVASGPQAYLLRVLPVAPLVRDIVSEALKERCAGLIEEGVSIADQATLEVAMPRFEGDRHQFLPVLRTNPDGTQDLVGTLHQIDVLRAYSRALADTAREEHS